jgi:predicted DNA binding protein
MRLEGLEQRATAMVEDARHLAKEAAEIRSLLFAAQPSDEEGISNMKREDGRLTDEGIRAINAAYETGATVTQVAKRFGITASGASQRRKIWLAGKAPRN